MPVSPLTLNMDRYPAQASFTRSGGWLKRKDETSHRKRVEVTSARKTQVHGDVVNNQRRTSQRRCNDVPSRQLLRRPKTCTAGKGLCCPEPSIQLTRRQKIEVVMTVDKTEEGCSGCELVATESVVNLRTGKVVCNTCPAWMLECEAREWLQRIRAKGPRNQKEGFLMMKDLFESIKKRRGLAGAQALQAEMLAIRGDK